MAEVKVNIEGENLKAVLCLEKSRPLRKKGESGMDFWKIARSGKESMKLKFRNLGTGQWVVFLLLGLLLAVAALPVSHKEEKKAQQESVHQEEIQFLKRN